MISHTPHGVAGNMEYWSKHIRPTLITWKPSTSLSGETALQILLSSMCSEKEVGPGASVTVAQLLPLASSLSGLSCKPALSTTRLYVPRWLPSSICTQGTQQAQPNASIKAHSSCITLPCTIPCIKISRPNQGVMVFWCGRERLFFFLSF